MNRDAPLTAAQRAVLHIVHRAQEDCDFAAVMRDTESLRLCLRAVAKHRGESIEETRHRVNSAIRNNPGESEVDRLTRRLAQADKNLAELREQKTKRQTEEDAATGQSALNAICELLRIAECGQPDVLTIDNIRDCLTGGPLGKHAPDKIGSVPCRCLPGQTLKGRKAR